MGFEELDDDSEYYGSYQLGKKHGIGELRLPGGEIFQG
jgi:hypothetical protein